jgi:tetratricopeptide (TPR) repeat protein
LGKIEEADRFLRFIAPPDEIAHAENTLAAMRAFAAAEPTGQEQIVRYVVEFVRNTQRKVHPRPLLLLLTEALDYARQLNLTPITAHLLQDIGECYHRLGELDQAVKHYNQALPLSRRLGDRIGEADILASLGHVYSDLGNRAIC